MAERKLDDTHKRFIIERLAAHEGPQDVVDALEAKYQIKISRQAIQCYDPGTFGGRNLADEYRRYFYECRAYFERAIKRHAMRSVAFRLDGLRRVYESSISDVKLPDNEMAMRALKEAREEDIHLQKTRAGAYAGSKVDVTSGGQELSVPTDPRQMTREQLMTAILTGIAEGRIPVNEHLYGIADDDPRLVAARAAAAQLPKGT